jgi:hypothetical protein
LVSLVVSYVVAVTQFILCIPKEMQVVLEFLHQTAHLLI